MSLKLIHLLNMGVYIHVHIFVLAKAMIVTYLKYYRQITGVQRKYLNLWEISLY